MTPQNLAEAITPRTRAVIVVHLFGQPPDMMGSRPWPQTRRSS